MLDHGTEMLRADRRAAEEYLPLLELVMQVPEPQMPSPVRCAIYTRKSTEHRLNIDFNTLENQREVCSAYVTSQRHKGWIELPQHYDDGGQSGASLERPAMQQLMDDIEAGEINVVVIYKIDRLTRSLIDFIRLLELFERRSVMFVSVTQAFDTSDSMGRLILNILLTFAQFEREMMADRVRDKIRGMKRRGKYTGGAPPYGYDLMDRKLVVNEAEATEVRRIFRRYLELGQGEALFSELQTQGFRSKLRVTRKGKVVGGGIVSRGMLQNLLSNPLYVGQVRHHGEVFPGEHEAIVDRELWDAVQVVRESRRKVQKTTGPTPNILSGLLFDCVGRRMTIVGDRARGRESRYYASDQSRWGKRESIKRFRADADSIEDFVVLTVCELFENREKLRNCLSGLDLDGFALKRLADAGRQASRRLSEGRFDLRRQILTLVLSRVDAATDRVTMVFRARAVEKFLLWDGLASISAAGDVKEAAGPHFVLEVPASALRYQRALVYPIEPRDRARQSKPNPGLIALLQEARKAQALMDSRRDLSLVQAARVYRRGPSTFARILRLNYLAPDIVAAILDGMQPSSLHRKKLLLCTLPMDWALQRKLLGFDPRGDAMDPRVERAERLQQRQQDRMRAAELQSGALRLESVHQTEVIEE